MAQDCTEFAVLIQCHDSTGCDEMGDYFATEADTMILFVAVFLGCTSTGREDL